MKYKSSTFIFHDYHQSCRDAVTKTTATRGGVILLVVMLVKLPSTVGDGYASENSLQVYNPGSGCSVGESMMVMQGLAVLEQMVVGVEVEYMDGTEVVVKTMKHKHSTMVEQEHKIIEVNSGNTKINSQDLSFLRAMKDQFFRK